ncbi:hypothetical protein NP493_563g01009 [Ridgeia piscesae]|uniref:Uncharacterized protein n=1 Tax=Ridgeia piscesae TaxID=27915 RepID=A0AAD9KV93_RIDPI|nr:hypothetical protein NP493_563g01009 [Ridgeia piscesae]
MTIGLKAGQLDITVGAPDNFRNHTKGLMGAFNGDPTDDLLPPGENAVALSNTSSEWAIYYDFGEKWRINTIDSLFYNAPGESYSMFAHTKFKPLFFEELLKDKTISMTLVKNTCGDNKECIFDLVVTGKQDVAASTLETNSKNVESATTLANASPNITVSTVFNVTVGQDNALTVNTSDPNGDMVTVNLTSHLPEGASFIRGVYTWKPANMEPMNISFSASDGKGGVAAADVSINLCNCSGHGECLFDLLADGYELKQTFRIVQCNCFTGWEGDYCELDLDGCQDNPCTAGTNCTDVTPAEQVASGKSYNCSACPDGTEDNEGTCLPINECDPNNPRHDCEQICIDKLDSFECTCKDGYRLTENNRNCTDIDECEEMTSDCQQKCANTNGSFTCSCVEGYELNIDNKTCTIVAEMEEGCNLLNCSHGCKATACFCWAGYNLTDDGMSCQDIDECLEKTAGCDHICTNFDGGFNCSCTDGFQLMNDKKICKPCPSGTWGKGCLRDCSCRDSDTECNATTGCAECPAGFEGADCQEDIDECTENNPCGDNANCINTVGTFKCVCSAGFTQYNATTCHGMKQQ